MWMKDMQSSKLLVLRAVPCLVMLFMMEFSDFSILVWNIRGAASSRGRRHVKDLVRKFKPSLFVLLETHV